ALLHGQGRALQPDPRSTPPRRRCLPGSTRRGRRRGRPEGGRDLAGRRRRRHVPGGDAAEQGVEEEVRAQAEDRLGPGRAQGRGASRPGRAQGDRPALPAREAGGLLRRADPDGRPRGTAPAGDAPGLDPAPDGTDLRALRGNVTVARPLLAIDGDSLAHRAYHALPKSMTSALGRPSGALVGFANFRPRLWEAEEPRTVVVGWDTLGVPTYRGEAFPSYQSGRQFDDALVEQLDLLPELVSAFGFTAAKAPGYEAD